MERAGDLAKAGLDAAGFPALGTVMKDTVLTDENAARARSLIQGQSPGKETPRGQAAGASAGPVQEGQKPVQSPLERAVNLAKLGAHLPEMKQLGADIQKNGFTAENVAKMKEIMPDLKGVITPENMQLFKELTPDKFDSIFTPEVRKELREKFPGLSEKLGGEKLEKFKSGLGELQKNLTKENIGGIMNQMAPWVKTSQGEGTLNMLDRMVGDPNKLGGGDRNLSTEDFREIARGVLKTGTGQQFRDQMLLNNVPQITHTLLTGREIQNPRRIERRLNIARNQATPERIACEAKHRQDVLGSVGLPDSTVPRHFTEQEVQSLINAGQRAQQMGFGGGMGGGNAEERVGALMQNVVEPLKKSVNPADGISQQELHNIAELGNMSYDVLGSLYQALGGRFR